MEAYPLFAAAGLILLIGFFGEFVFSKTNIPDVIWLILVGIIIGVFFKDFVHSSVFTTIGPIFTTFALIFILFEGAININLKHLVAGIFHGVNLTVLNFVLSCLTSAFIMMFFGWEFIHGLLLGAIIGGSSSAIVIPIIKNLNVKKKTTLILTIESAVSDVLCIVGAITIIQIITLHSFSVDSILQDLIYSFTVAILFGVLGGLVWIKIQKYIEQISKSYITTIAFLLILYAFVEYIHANGAIACLAFGVILGNSKRIFSLIEEDFKELMSPSAKFFYAEISFFVKSFFFVYIGLIINFSDFKLILIGLLLSVLLIFIRPLAVLFTSKKGLADKDKAVIEVLSPKGLAAAVLAQVPSHYNIPRGDQFSTIVLSVIFFSILLNTILVFLTERGHFLGVRNTVKNIVKNGKKK